MLSKEKCYEVLNRNEEKFTKEQVSAIREQLYQFAEIIANINPLNDDKEFTKQKGNPVQKGKHY